MVPLPAGHSHVLSQTIAGLNHDLILQPSLSPVHAQQAFEDGDFKREEHPTMRCTQHGGDVLFVPSMWGHATRNLRQSIGTAYEFSLEPFCLE